MKFYILSLMLVTTLIAGCSCSNRQNKNSDFLENFNRTMYSFNYELLDPYLIRPITIAWRNYIPQPIRNGLINFTSNIEEPAVMINYFLQGNPYKGSIHFTRFFLNSLLGIGGFIDVAGISNQKLQREQQHRFSSTLGYYGICYGPYIHLPFYGSFTMRDDIGNMVDMLYPTLSWLTWPLIIGKWTLEGLEIRARLLDSENLLQQSPDPYVTIRETYFQNHDFIANGSKLKSKENPNTKVINNDLSEIDS